MGLIGMAQDHLSLDPVQTGSGTSSNNKFFPMNGRLAGPIVLEEALPNPRRSAATTVVGKRFFKPKLDLQFSHSSGKTYWTRY